MPTSAGSGAPNAPSANESPVVGVATIAAAALVGQHVIGKATRDALFLSFFSADRLPMALCASAMLSGLFVMLFTRAVARHRPVLVVPRLLALHASLLVVEWLLARRYGSLAAIAVYLHTASLGPTLLSSFWLVVSEAFDPYSGKRAMGRIGAGATFGGVIGGAMAWCGSKLVSVPTMLLAGAALSLVGAWGARFLGRPSGRDSAGAVASSSRSGFAVLRDTPYLILLGALVFVGAVLQTLLDYALGAQAKAAYGGGVHLLSFFSLFQTAIGVGSFAIQMVANRPALDRLGIGGTIGLLPCAVGAAGILAVASPSLPSAALQRGAEGVLRASLFRSAYEVLFTPLPHSLKRPTKAFIDVTLDRFGGVVGSALTLALVALCGRQSLRAVTVVSVVAAAAQIVIAYRLQLGYVATLAERLRSGALELDATSVIDATTRETLSRTMSDLDRRALLARIQEAWAAKTADADHGSGGPGPAPAAEGSGVAAAAPADDVVRAMIALRSGDCAAIRAALRSDAARTPLLAPQVIELLTRDDVARDAMRVLEPVAPDICGLILDVVLDESRNGRLRRRAARLLRQATSQRVAEGLLLALSAEPFDVRYSCARVLVELHERNGSLRFDAAVLFARALHELEIGPGDKRTLDLVFDLLSLTGPSEPMQLAYGALQSSDSFLRGVALEYLDSVLPVQMRVALAARISRPPPPAEGRATKGRSLDELMKSRGALHRQLEELRRSRDPDLVE